MKKSNVKVVAAVILAVIAACFISTGVMAEPGMGTLPKGVTQVWTAYEGNIKYFVKEGQKVSEGTPLFFVKRNDMAPNSLELEHNIAYTEKEFRRYAKLIKSHSVSQESFDDKEHAYQQAIDALAKWKANMRDCLYTAPFDCEVTKLLYLQGSGVGDGNPMINIKEIPASELPASSSTAAPSVFKKDGLPTSKEILSYKNEDGLNVLNAPAPQSK
jgi:hypothetical protein